MEKLSVWFIYCTLYSRVIPDAPEGRAPRIYIEIFDDIMNYKCSDIYIYMYIFIYIFIYAYYIYYIYIHYICIALEIISIDCRIKKTAFPLCWCPFGAKTHCLVGRNWTGNRTGAASWDGRTPCWTVNMLTAPHCRRDGLGLKKDLNFKWP